MKALIEMLAPAAARGVEVVIFTNDRTPAPITFKWHYRETNCTAVARFRGAGLDLIVQDCDGDRSWWELSEGRTVLARGDTYECEPYYHFDACLLAAEEALRVEVRRRKAALLEGGL